MSRITTRLRPFLSQTFRCCLAGLTGFEVDSSRRFSKLTVLQRLGKKPIASHLLFMNHDQLNAFQCKKLYGHSRKSAKRSSSVSRYATNEHCARIVMQPMSFEKNGIATNGGPALAFFCRFSGFSLQFSFRQNLLLFPDGESSFVFFFAS